ncbi:hypothetical protein [Flavobacterium aquiphilum]|uniref:hypothetical protein n=1 Tax=Flavobacterium aquiphilum TaxID=3003261 RepID=UPI0024816683|nr:hypothetical protein [Flavobacterium aquiphilum]
MEQNSKEYLKNSKIINNTKFKIINGEISENIIFATFHLGSYRTIISYLYECGFKVALIIDDSVFTSQLDAFKETVTNILKGKINSDLIILNVKERTSIIKLKQLVENGYVMAVYLDGNSGINVEAQNFSKNFIPINFLNQQINVKYGVGKLASILNAKIIPILSYRVNENEEYNNTIEIFKEISISDFENKEDFEKKSIEYCYSLLEEKLLKYPTQWECWGYIHKWFNRDIEISFSEPSKNITKFNSDRYNLFEVNDSNFLFDLFSYKSYPISNELFKLIEKQNFDKIENNLLLELNQKNILI